MRPVIAGDVDLRAAGEQVSALEEEVHASCMINRVALRLSEVVHIVDDVSNAVRRWADDDHDEVIDLLAVFIVLVHKVAV